MTEPFVSTGSLPAAERVRSLVDEAHELYRSNADGACSSVYPALARVPPDLYGICVVNSAGDVYATGDADHEFTIMSVAKPFVFALVCEELGHEEVRRRVGVNATGLPFNSPEAIERSEDGRTNPMVNAGAIATTSLVGGANVDERWERLRQGLSRFAGRELALDDEVSRSASETNHRNRELARLLDARHGIEGDPAEAVDLYTRQSCLAVTARDLAAMGATLADGGVQPLTRERVVSEPTCRHTLSVDDDGGAVRDVGRLAVRRRDCRGRAGSAEASSRSRPARAGWGRSRRRSTRPATASAGSSRRASSRELSGSTCSRPARRTRRGTSARSAHLRQRPRVAREAVVGRDAAGA